ncbi:hypothetical protein GQ43DRAFT_7678 [Delitschia confertaspora ATCC 74209]|uniref:Uncharacterized protein n=1 Tax=Delitschia confertaspora ATCC 74209 TaxID=1513339 RepID=A0A9P4JMB8_9PLEO|nr:hypothetical protein GQ43DRAFT_7678 [Delitschia confertaspora ATCC 74209]
MRKGAGIYYGKSESASTELNEEGLRIAKCCVRNAAVDLYMFQDESRREPWRPFTRRRISRCHIPSYIEVRGCGSGRFEPSVRRLINGLVDNFIKFLQAALDFNKSIFELYGLVMVLVVSYYLADVSVLL